MRPSRVQTMSNPNGPTPYAAAPAPSTSLATRTTPASYPLWTTTSAGVVPTSTSALPSPWSVTPSPVTTTRCGASVVVSVTTHVARAGIVPSGAVNVSPAPIVNRSSVEPAASNVTGAPVAAVQTSVKSNGPSCSCVASVSTCLVTDRPENA
ncbi:Uncharacterised protein [Mycobacteroides abscessus]|nr:Uncharacterised protein [Mycobacteroides abscessus]